MKALSAVPAAIVSGGILLCAPWMSVAQPSQSERIATLQQEAVALYRAGQYDQAAQRYRQLAALQPKNADIFKDLIWVLWCAERFEELARVAGHLTSLREQDTEVWNILGRAQLAIGNKAAALQAFQNSLLVDSQQLTVWRTVARLCLELEQYDAARQLLTQLIQRYPDEHELYPLLARAQALQGDFAAAAPTWAKAREFFPDTLAYAYQQAVALSRSGQRDQALAVLRPLLTQQDRLLAPDQQSAARGVARLCLELEQYDAARQLLTQLIQRYPDEHELYPLLARAQALQGDFAAAAPTWAKAREFFPDTLAYYYQEADALYQGQHPAQALLRVQALLRQQKARLFDPAQLNVWRATTQLLLDLRQYDAANQLLTELIQHHPNETTLYPLLARTHMFQEKFFDAAANWVKAREAFPDNLVYHYQEAVALYRSGQSEQALAVLQSLMTRHQAQLMAPDQLKIWRTMTQLYLDLRHYDAARQLLAELIQRYPQQADLYPMLARTEMFQGDYREAAIHWAKAREFFPDNPDYPYQEAIALLNSNQQPAASAVLEQLVSGHPDYRPALTILVDLAIMREDWAGAARLLEQQLVTPMPGDEYHWLTLAHVYRQLNHDALHLKALDRALQANPSLGEVYLSKAEYYSHVGQPAKAMKLYRQLLSLNPWALRALTRLAEVQFSRGRYAQAIRLIERVRRMNPGNPYLILSHAQYLFAQGTPAQSKRLLTDWLEHNQGPPLCVLLYHGLATSPDDPMLASPVHTTVEMFEDHLRALREAGFEPVTAEQVNAWYQGKGELPPRPILITFDDARLDSFERADPILARYHFKATMFVPIVNVERNLPGYASWDDVIRYHQTGRWEIQSHGVRAANYIPIDSQGHEGLFLVNRQWLDDEQRVETPEEWKQRIAKDYRLSQVFIEQQVGTKPVAFAYPNGNFGQGSSTPNVKDAAPINLALAHETFGLLFHQDVNGINVRSDNPVLLARIEPRSSWRGADFVRHFTNKNPFALIRFALLRQAIWQGRMREANRWLTQLRQQGIPESMLLLEQAQMYFAIGDPARGRQLIDQALQRDHSPEVAQRAEELRRGDVRWSWSPQVQLYQDHNDREHLIVQQQLGSWPIGRSLWRVTHRSGMFREKHVPSVTGHGVGLGVTLNLGLFHQIAADVMRLFYTGEAGNTVSASGAMRSKWTDSFSTAVEVGQRPIETARALNASVRDQYVSLRAAWKGQGPWQASVRGKAAHLTDENQRYASVVEVSRGLTAWPSVRGIYRFTVDTTQTVSPNYYSPQTLLLHQAGVEVKGKILKGLGLGIQYLPGYGTEEDVPSRFSQTLEVNTPLIWRGSTWLVPVFSMTRTPTYQSHTLNLMFQFRF